MCYAPDLWQKFKDLLDANGDTERRCASLKQMHYSTHKFLFRVHRLTWHEGKIPDTEIWVKLGGDKGGGVLRCHSSSAT